MLESISSSPPEAWPQGVGATECVPAPGLAPRRGEGWSWYLAWPQAGRGKGLVVAPGQALGRGGLGLRAWLVPTSGEAVAKRCPRESFENMHG